MKILRSWWRTGLSLLCAEDRQGTAGNALSSTTIVLTQYQVKNLYRERFRALLSEYIFSTRLASGNIMAEAYYEQGDSSIMWLIERWRDSGSYAENGRGVTASMVCRLAKEGLLTPAEKIFVNDVETLSGETRPEDDVSSGESLTVMLFIEVKKGTENRFKRINHAVAERFRSYPDVLIFQLWQVADQKAKFIVYKRFRTREAFQLHLKDPVIEPVIQFMQTSIMEPPFEKGYHYLVSLA